MKEKNAKRKSKERESGFFVKNGIRIITAPPKSMPTGWLGCFIALKPDGTIDQKRSGVFKQ